MRKYYLHFSRMCFLLISIIFSIDINQYPGYDSMLLKSKNKCDRCHYWSNWLVVSVLSSTEQKSYKKQFHMPAVISSEYVS